MYGRLSAVLPAVVMLGAIGSAFGQAEDADTDPHLVGWWKLDDEAGTAAVDSSEHGRDGALADGLSFEANSVPGRVGKALRLDGETGVLRIPDYKGVVGTQSRTVAVWIKTTESKGQVITWGEGDFGKMWNLTFIRGRLGITPDGGYLYMNAPVHDDAWHHVAAAVEEAELPADRHGQ